MRMIGMVIINMQMGRAADWTSSASYSCIFSGILIYLFLYTYSSRMRPCRSMLDTHLRTTDTVLNTDFTLLAEIK